MEYKKQDHESSFDYILRLIDGKSSGIYDIDYIELFKLAFNVELAPDECRKRFYGLKMILPYIDREKLKNTSEDDIFKELEVKKQELFKEKVKIQTEKSILNQMLREESRFELFIEHAVNAIREKCLMEVNKELKFGSSPEGDKSGVLLFADPHYAKELKITGLRGEIINEYNIDIFEKRMWKLLDNIINIINKEEFKRISVFNLGDELEGILRVGQLMTLKLGLVDSTISFSYFIANWLNELSKYVGIDYYSTQGNHTDIRLITGKKNDFPHENMSKIIQTLISEILKDNPNITIHKNNNDKIFTNIQGFNILGIHGEEKDLAQAIRDFSFIYNTKIDYLVSGHKHHSNSSNIGVNKGCIGVGSIIGIDDYAMDLKKISNPTASFVVFENGIGKILEYTIYLDN